MKTITPILRDFEKRCRDLAKRHGYRIVYYPGEHVQLVSLGIRGFTADQLLPQHFRSAFSAVEYLIPICGPEYHADYSATFPEP